VERAKALPAQYDSATRARDLQKAYIAGGYCLQEPASLSILLTKDQRCPMPSQRPFRLLVVEDEAAIRDGLVDVLIYHRYKVDCAVDGPDGLAKALTGHYDLILLDIMLPGMDGYEVCERIRASDRDQPIIMLTARTADDDVIAGLKLGADDYVAKPFSVQQLVLRIEAVLRRTHGDHDDDREIHTLAMSIDTANLNGKRGDEVVVFTRREMDLLKYLAEHSDRAVTREELLEKVWGYGKNVELETRTVDIHIAKIRRKIEPAPKTPESLLTVRGAGYRLIVKEEPDVDAV